jgi:2-phosphoglycerate kinase
MKSSLFASAEQLFRRAAALRAVQGGVVNVFSEALAVLHIVRRRMQSPIAIVGGLAGIHHQAVVTTLDIDVVVTRDRLDDFLRECAAEGLEIKHRSEHGWHAVVFRSGDETVEIQVVPEGEKSLRDPDYAPPTPSPEDLGVASGLGYASFA